MARRLSPLLLSRASRDVRPTRLPRPRLFHPRREGGRLLPLLSWYVPPPTRPLPHPRREGGDCCSSCPGTYPRPTPPEPPYLAPIVRVGTAAIPVLVRTPSHHSLPYLTPVIKVGDRYPMLRYLPPLFQIYSYRRRRLLSWNIHFTIFDCCHDSWAQITDSV